MKTNNNKSFGLITLPEFFIALKNVLIGNIKTDAEQWIHENKFCRGIPIESLVHLDENGFIRLLCDYNKNAIDFLDKNQLFYLTIMEG